MNDSPPAFACNLGALSSEEQTQRSAVAARVAARFREVQETTDGYTARLDTDPQLIQDALDWILFERRCCPFFRLELHFEPSDGPVWLRFGGTPGVKAFLSAAGFKASAPHAAVSRDS